MLRFYLRFLWNARKLVTDSTSRVHKLIAFTTTALATVGPLVARWVSPRLAQRGEKDLAAWLAGVPAWWSVIPITLLVVYGLLKANYELHAKAEAERDALVAKEALGPKLGIVFDPECDGCYTGGLVSLGVWNDGPRAEDVHIYLSAVNPGPRTGKLELEWAGEGKLGRPINTTPPSGHHHAILLVGNRGGYFFATNTVSGALGQLTGEYTVEVSVEAGNSKPVTARVKIDSEVEPPVRGVSV